MANHHEPRRLPGKSATFLPVDIFVDKKFRLVFSLRCHQPCFFPTLFGLTFFRRLLFLCIFLFGISCIHLLYLTNHVGCLSSLRCEPRAAILSPNIVGETNSAPPIALFINYGAIVRAKIAVSFVSF